MKTSPHKKILILVFCLLILIPSISYAQFDFKFAGIPCDGVEVECDFPMLMKLISNVIDFVVKLAFPLAIITISWAGFLYMTTAVSDTKSKAKEMLVKVAIGFGVLIAAWLIVKVVLNVFLDPKVIQQIPLEGV